MISGKIELVCQGQRQTMKTVSVYIRYQERGLGRGDIEYRIDSIQIDYDWKILIDDVDAVLAKQAIRKVAVEMNGIETFNLKKELYTQMGIEVKTNEYLSLKGTNYGF